jgi:hypothetical protein
MAESEQSNPVSTNPSRWKRVWSRFSILFASKTAMIGLIIVLFWVLAAIFAPLLTPYSPTEQDYKARNSPPSAAHILGTDDLGRDLWARLIYGARVVLVMLPIPDTGFLLDGVTRAGLKMMLNALSTCTMVRLGRVMGNYMIWVVPSNLKLIDRSTRYIQRLTGLDYQAANRLLFEVIEYVEPRMKADQAYPPVVGVSVMRVRHQLGNEEAEKRLMAEL